MATLTAQVVRALAPYVFLAALVMRRTTRSPALAPRWSA
jgi:hypothetical protein